jgi:hypothetical protein
MAAQSSEHSRTSIFELLRLSEPAYGDEQIFYNTKGGMPFNLPQFSITAVGTRGFTMPHSALTIDGQIAAASIIPATLKITRSGRDNIQSFAITQRNFGGDSVIETNANIDIKNLLEAYRIDDPRHLVRRLPRSAF